jgi:hypothetical protein
LNQMLRNLSENDTNALPPCLMKSSPSRRGGVYY